MTDDEILEVVSAHKEGKQIQWKNNEPGSYWKNCRDNKPFWDFANLNYRVKPIPAVVPYTDIVDFLGDSKKHGPHLIRKIDRVVVLPVYIREDSIHLFDTEKIIVLTECKYSELNNVYSWEDGHPCGIITNN